MTRTEWFIQPSKLFLFFFNWAFLLNFPFRCNPASACSVDQFLFATKPSVFISAREGRSICEIHQSFMRNQTSLRLFLIFEICMKSVFGSNESKFTRWSLMAQYVMRPPPLIRSFIEHNVNRLSKIVTFF